MPVVHIRSRSSFSFFLTILSALNLSSRFSASYLTVMPEDICRVGQNRMYTSYMTYDRMYGDFPAKNTVCTPYIPINVWFRPTLRITPFSLPCVQQKHACKNCRLLTLCRAESEHARHGFHCCPHILHHGRGDCRRELAVHLWRA